jgi:dipicolinate synthase subunit B
MVDLLGLKIGVALSGSFCTFERVISQIRQMVLEGAIVYPIMSFNSANMDTRFGRAEDFKKRLEEITNNKVMDTIQLAEEIGPKNMFDILVISPCTGNSLGKLANGITDTPLLMAFKAHLRNNKPVVIAVSTNDGLGMSMKNIGILMNIKNIYFVPFEQDNYKAKPNSLVAKMDMIIPSIYEAMDRKQIHPLL